MFPDNAVILIILTGLADRDDVLYKKIVSNMEDSISINILLLGL